MWFALRWIENNLERIPSNITAEIENALKEVKYNTYLVEHALLNELKNELRTYASKLNLSKAERQSIPKLGINLLEYAELKYINEC